MKSTFSTTLVLVTLFPLTSCHKGSTSESKAEAPTEEASNWVEETLTEAPAAVACSPGEEHYFLSLDTVSNDVPNRIMNKVIHMFELEFLGSERPTPKYRLEVCHNETTDAARLVRVARRTTLSDGTYQYLYNMKPDFMSETGVLEAMGGETKSLEVRSSLGTAFANNTLMIQGWGEGFVTITFARPYPGLPNVWLADGRDTGTLAFEDSFVAPSICSYLGDPDGTNVIHQTTEKTYGDFTLNVDLCVSNFNVSLPGWGPQTYFRSLIITDNSTQETYELKDREDLDSKIKQNLTHHGVEDGLEITLSDALKLKFVMSLNSNKFVVERANSTTVELEVDCTDFRQCLMNEIGGDAPQ